MISKEINGRPFEGVEINLGNIRDKWIHTFGFILLGHDIKNLDDIGVIIDQLIDL